MLPEWVTPALRPTKGLSPATHSLWFVRRVGRCPGLSSGDDTGILALCPRCPSRPVLHGAARASRCLGKWAPHQPLPLPQAQGVVRMVSATLHRASNSNEAKKPPAQALRHRRKRVSGQEVTYAGRPAEPVSPSPQQAPLPPRSLTFWPHKTTGSRVARSRPTSLRLPGLVHHLPGQ